MTPNSPNTPREELEARITALLLGELAAEEAASLRQAIAQDAELSRLHDRLRQAVGLVRETVTSPEQAALASPDAPKLSPDRRAALFTAFKVIRPKELRKAGRSRFAWRELVAVAAMIVILCLAAAIIAPNLYKARSAAPRQTVFIARDESWAEAREEFRAMPLARGERGQVTMSDKPVASDTLRRAAVDLDGQPQDGAALTTTLTVGEALSEIPAYSLSVTPAPTRSISEFVSQTKPEGLSVAGYAFTPPPPVRPPVSESSAASEAKVPDGPATRQLTTIALPSTGDDTIAAIVDRKNNEAQTPLAAKPTSPADGTVSSGPRRSGEGRGGGRLGDEAKPEDYAGVLVAGARPAGLPSPGVVDLGKPMAPPSETRPYRFPSLGYGISPVPAPAETVAAVNEDASGKQPALLAAQDDRNQPKTGNLAQGPLVTNASFAADGFFAYANSPQGQGVGQSGGISGFGHAANSFQRSEGLPALNLEREALDTLGDRNAPLGINGAAGRYYRLAPSNPSAAGAKDAVEAEKTLADLSKSERSDPATGISTLQFDAEGKNVVRDLQRESGQKADEKPQVAQQSADGDATSIKRYKIALPESERVEAKENLRVDTGLVVISEINYNDPATGLPALKQSDVAVTVEESLRRQAQQKLDERYKEIARVGESSARRMRETNRSQADGPFPRLAAGVPVPQPEVTTTDNAFSTFSLNVSDVSFKLAAASLEKGQMPDPATVRSEEFINAFDYRDPEPKGSAPIAFAWERARYPFAHDRDLLRFSVKTAASGRQPGRPLNLVLLLDNSGSMERADRVRIRQECLRVLAGQFQPQDRVSVVAFARTPRLWVDGLPGDQAGELPQRVGGLAPEGGTNLEDAMNVAYRTALKHFLANGVNRVVLLTDGAANLGDVEPESLKKMVEAHRKQGVALDCFGIGWDGLNDALLEALSRNGDGRYGFVNTPEAATTEFAGQLAGALKVAASDVKVQVEWNPRRVTAYRQIGYAKHQLKKEQFRDNTVDAAEIGAAEAGNALYIVRVNPRGDGPLGTVRVRFKVPGTGDYREHEWTVPYEGAASALDRSSSSLRLAASASAFSEWLVSSPFAAEVTPDKLLAQLSGVPETWPADPRPKKLEWMIRQARSVAGK
jgi:Mg-chelatase subunit ChlD